MYGVRTHSLPPLLFAAILALVPGAAAQRPVDPAQLPARTSFYLFWHGTPSPEIRRNNSLYGLWDDPDFAAVRTSVLEAFLSGSDQSKDRSSLTREELGQYASLLDNGFLIGYHRRPDSAVPEKSSPSEPRPAWSGFFFIYDRSGKEALLQKAVLRIRGAEKEIPKITELTVEGVPALKIERQSGVTYWAETGAYALGAGESSVFEEILRLLLGTLPKAVLGGSPAFAEAKPLLAGGILEFFLSVPSVKEFATPSPAGSASPVSLFLNGIKLDSVHSVAGHVALEGARTHMAATVLGDTAPGGLFDIWSDGQSTPASFTFLGPDTISYSEWQFNLLGTYNTIKRALAEAGPKVAPLIAPLEAAAETRLGMPLPEALGLLTGEVASLQSSPTLDASQKIYLVGIRNRPDTLKLARTVLGERITSERNEGSNTFLKISLQGRASAAGVAEWRFYHVAVTPQLVLGASTTETLRSYLGREPASEPSGAPQSLRDIRAQYPEKVNGFSYFNLQKLDWPALKAGTLAARDQAAQVTKSAVAGSKDKHLSDLLGQVPPELFPRHLHTMAGASWKDARGVHFDEWVE